jgi:hypothetical protein
MLYIWIIFVYLTRVSCRIVPLADIVCSYELRLARRVGHSTRFTRVRPPARSEQGMWTLRSYWCGRPVYRHKEPSFPEMRIAEVTFSVAVFLSVIDWYLLLLRYYKYVGATPQIATWSLTGPQAAAHNKSRLADWVRLSQSQRTLLPGSRYKYARVSTNQSGFSEEIDQRWDRIPVSEWAERVIRFKLVIRYYRYVGCE